ncbi:hypothetical protein EMIT013CA1_20064 [Bacillus sp. IT-13CA1]
MIKLLSSVHSHNAYDKKDNIDKNQIPLVKGICNILFLTHSKSRPYNMTQ